ncbi:MAG: HAMP domain-containing histidine kinase [Magnetococcales bacterium]|nr:HAMP domain-containing histidine kinase [Magnetococcales bacterium]
MAALGGLVAGVAHEINTPVGVSVTAATTLKTRTLKFLEVYKSGAMKRADLHVFLKHAIQSTELIFNNLQRAGDLIKSFKQIAVDRTSDEDRSFNVKEYLNEILLSLRPKTKKTNHEFIINCDDDLEFNSSPGVISQIITNLLMNSMVHALEDQDQGKIIMDAKIQNGQFIFKYSDSGRGIPPENLEKIFDPFFTTKRGEGGSGLGLHIIYNLITQKLKGEISCTSILNEGTEFIICLPIDRGE